MSLSNPRIEEGPVPPLKRPWEAPGLLAQCTLTELVAFHGLWVGIAIRPEEIDEWLRHVREMGRAFEGLHVRAILEKLCVEVLCCDSSMESPEFIFRADIDCETRIITLYEPMLRELQEAVAHYGMVLPAGVTLEEILLAHELYHLVIYDGGHRNAEHALQGEIKAHLFALLLLNLPFYPWLLDFMHLAYRFPGRVERHWINRIRRESELIKV